VAAWSGLSAALRGLKGEPRHGSRVRRTILTAAILVMVVAMAIVFIFAPQTASFMAPGYSGDELALYAGLLRSCAPVRSCSPRRGSWAKCWSPNASSDLRLATSCTTSGSLAAHSCSLPCSASTAPPSVSPGAGGHLGIRLVGIFRTSFRHGFAGAANQGIGEFVKLMGPRWSASRWAH